MAEIIRVSMPLTQWLLTMAGTLGVGLVIGLKFRK